MPKISVEDAYEILKNDDVDEAPSPAKRGAPLVAMVMLKKAGRAEEEVAKKSEMVKSASGVVVPMPTRPPLVTMNAVADDEPTTNAGDDPRSVVSIDSRAHGVEVLIPTLPVTPGVVPPRMVNADTEVVAKENCDEVAM